MLKPQSIVPLLAVAAAFFAMPSLGQAHRPVLMISVDGMKPEYVTHADEHHLRIPTLHRFLAEGAHASGVQGVFPSVTYPSHTTLITGVWPAEHSILNNERFDPERKLGNAWYWYAPQINVPTLWDAAHAAGLRTASVGWPVTVDASSIDTLIPEYWRGSLGDSVNPDDQMMMDAVSRPPGEVARIGARIGVPYMSGNETNLAGDEVKTRYTLDILRQHRPEFVTLHLSSLDQQQHLHGPFSAEANADLESIDGMLERLAKQEFANFPNALVVVVSDHGFAKVEHSVNLFIPFVEAGLLQISGSARGESTVTAWQAQPWTMGGMAAIMLRDPADTGVRARVKALLDKLAATPAAGVEAVLAQDELAGHGGITDASFVVTFRAGYRLGGALTGPLVTDVAEGGTHGYDPVTTPDMRASFFALGEGIARGRNLGLVDMRQIAPTLARAMGIALPSAKAEALDLR